MPIDRYQLDRRDRPLRSGRGLLPIDPATGKKKIDRDLDKVEQIFEKFNPQQIDGWR